MEDSIKKELGYLNEYIKFLDVDDKEDIEFFKENIETIVTLNKKELIDYKNLLMN